MYLKRLELHGFKSFPNSTKVEFNNGITSIVGPNGSGKSNISDAIRWVLGEKSAKNLRGGKMQDVIFAGTDLKKPLSFAKVTLVIDNKESNLNFETEEVSVTRKMYRQGENEYFINNKVCRLKDIYELFMDTGIGKEGYSIIGQGRIDEILSGKPEERRLLIEEAVGIVKYKNRKKEAESKLDKQRNNLELIENTLGELEKQVKPLEKDSKKAKIFLSLQEELKKIDINIHIRDIESFNVQIDKIKKDLELTENDLYDTTQHRILEKQKMQLNKIKFDETKKEIEKTKKNIVENRLETEQKYNDIKLYKEKIKNIYENISRIEEENKTLEQKNNLLNTESDGLLLDKKRIDIEIESKTCELNKNDKILNNFKAKLNNYEAKNEKFKLQIEDKQKILSNSKYEIEINKNKKIDKNHLILQLNKEKNDLNTSLSQKNIQLQKINAQKNTFNSELVTLKNELEKIIANISTENKLLDELVKTKNNLSNEYNEITTKGRLLNGYKEQYEGYYFSVKTILKQAKIGTLQGVYGTVGELIRVPKQYELAIETALSSRMQNIIVENSDNAKSCIQYLKNNKSGRATLLPLDMVKKMSPYSKLSVILKEKGVLGIAKDLIKYDEKYENIYSNILERVLIVDSLENAIKVNKKYNAEIKIVTLDGDILSVGGAMTGGSYSKKSSNLLGREREIKELREKCNLVKVELENINLKIANKEDEINSKKRKIDNFNKNIQQKIILLNNEEQQQKIISKIIKDEETAIIEKNNSICLQEREIKILDEHIIKNKKNYEESFEEIKILQAEFDKFKLSIQNESKDNDSLLTVVYNQKLHISELQLKNNAILEKIKSNSELKKEQLTKIQLNYDNVLHNKNIISEIEEDIENCEQIIINLKNEKENLGLLLIEKDKICKSSESIILNLDLSINDLAEEIQSLEKNKLKTEYLLENLEEKNRKSFDELWTSYSLTYNKSKQFYDSTLNYNKLQKDRLKLKSDIKALGNINISAIEQYKEVSTRYEFLLTQRNDIIDAEQKLGVIIDDLSKMIEEQFKENFEVICKNFNEVFKEIFGGGFAKLILADPENVLTSGIDIEAKPTGKSLKNITLLSGGEKALTAIALLFAILKMKPSPFCVLDEIDAALDDNNVIILANFLKKFASNTQFIMISHKKGIMEISDIIYGVTMKEQGISTLLSIDFDKI